MAGHHPDRDRGGGQDGIGGRGGVSGPAGAPRFWARREIELIPPGRPAQPYHAAAGLDLAAAGQLISQVAHAAEQAAAAGLRALAGPLPVGSVRAVAVVVKATSVPDRLPDVLRSHAWMHTAEGMLYRQAVLAAAQECGWRAHAVSWHCCRPRSTP